jgi:hypothetical protein
MFPPPCRYRREGCRLCRPTAAEETPRDILKVVGISRAAFLARSEKHEYLWQGS